MNIGFIAVVAITLLLLVYSGMLFDPVLIRRQFDPVKLRDLGVLVVSNYVLVPLFTLLIIRLCDFPPVLNLVLLTMALLPCASAVPPFVSMAGEAPERSLFVFIAMSLLNIAATPVLLWLLALPWVLGGDFMPQDGATVALFKYLASVFTPMALGAAFRILAPAHCRRWQARLMRVLPLLLPLTCVLFAYSYRAEILMLGWRDFEALLLFEGVCIATGLALARSTPGNRIATLLICGLRNTAMGLAFVLVVFPHTTAPTYMLVFIAVSFAGAVIGVGARKRLVGRPLTQKEI